MQFTNTAVQPGLLPQSLARFVVSSPWCLAQLRRLVILPRLQCHDCSNKTGGQSTAVKGVPACQNAWPCTPTPFFQLQCLFQHRCLPISGVRQCIGKRWGFPILLNSPNTFHPAIRAPAICLELFRVLILLLGESV